jgi:hypothetical protein
MKTIKRKEMKNLENTKGDVIGKEKCVILGLMYSLPFEY